MSDKPLFDDTFTEQLRLANLVFDTALKRAQLRTEGWKAGAAIFGAGAAFSGALIALWRVFVWRATGQ